MNTGTLARASSSARNILVLGVRVDSSKASPAMNRASALESMTLSTMRENDSNTDILIRSAAFGSFSETPLKRAPR